MFVIEYQNENEYRKKERVLKKYNMMAYKKLVFEIYPKLREGKFKGEVKENIDKNTTRYELKLPTDALFSKVHGDITVHYSVNSNEKIVMLETITPEDILTEAHQSKLTTYKGVMVSKKNAEKDIFKINLLNMLNNNK